MPKPPRKPREIQRGVDLASSSVSSRPLFRRQDKRQPDLFAPAFIEPCKPTLSDRVPAGDLWQYEIKHDGYRAQCHVHAGHVRIFTRRGHEWSDRMPGIRVALERLPVQSAILDGEAVIVGPDGVSDFFALHKALANQHAPEAILYAFDILHLDGEDLRPKQLVERRAMLAELLVGAYPALQISEHLLGDGAAMLKAACDIGLEGIVAKRRDAPYRSGTVETWRKIKCSKTEAFAVTGFEPRGRTGVASLKISTLKDGVLVRAGWVGSGLSERDSRAIRALLDRGEHVVVEVEFRGWTPAGELRHPVFKGWHV